MTGRCAHAVGRPQAAFDVAGTSCVGDIVVPMPVRARVPAADIAELAGAQAGAVSRRQALAFGMTAGRIDHHVHSGRWQRVLPGVHVIFTRPVSYLTRAWAAVLYAGPGAAVGLQTAAYLWNVSDDPPADVHVIVPADRRVHRQPGVRVHIRRARSPAAFIPPGRPG